jgi:hypothetical protein
VLHQHLAATTTPLAATRQVKLDASLSGCLREQSADLNFYYFARGLEDNDALVANDAAPLVKETWFLAERNQVSEPIIHDSRPCDFGR